MNKLLLILLVALITSCSANPYVKIGAGYKFREIDVEWKAGVNDSFAYKISCKIELGLEAESLSYGVRHVSQCFVGEPFNDLTEYSKEEVFVDYKYVFKL